MYIHRYYKVGEISAFIALPILIDLGIDLGIDLCVDQWCRSSRGLQGARTLVSEREEANI